MTIIEDRITFYKSQGATGGTLPELEYNWLLLQGCDPASIPDMWNQYLASQSLPNGSISDGRSFLLYPINTGQGPRLGPNLCLNGEFDVDTTGWTIQGGSTVLSVVDGFMNIATSAGNSGAVYSFATVVGKRYKVVGFIQPANTGGSTFRIGASVSDTSNPGQNIIDTNGATTTTYFTATTTSSVVYARFMSPASTHRIDNISIREVL